MLQVHVTCEPTRQHLVCVGRLDCESLAGFVQTASGLLAASGPARVVADLSAVVHVDSSGVSALVHLSRRLAQSGRQLVLEGLEGQPLALLRSIGLDRLLMPAMPRAEQGRAAGPRWASVPERGIFEAA